MNYQEARAYLDQIGARGNLLGLASVTCLMDALGNPQDKLKFVHIAGTNGKGSVMALLESVLIEAGIRVGRYLSPALFSYEEKIQVDHSLISREDVARLTERIREAIGEMEQRGEPLPTIFEVETAMSFLYFLEKDCDLVLLETGMGGAEDATNIVTTTVLEVFSSISMDHMEYLGDTPEKIAAVKAGIIKPGTRAVSDQQDPAVAKVLREAAARKGARLTFAAPEEISELAYGLKQQRFSYREHKEIQIHLPGTYQIRNAALALEAVDALRELGYEIPEETVRKGFSRAVWKGRFQILHERPVVVMDGAHNPDGARRLRESLETYFPGRRISYIFGVFSDKEYDKIIRITADLADRIYTVQTRDNPRALSASELARCVAEVNPNVICVQDVERALDLALSEAEPEDVIVLFGSLSWLWEAEAYFASVHTTVEEATINIAGKS